MIQHSGKHRFVVSGQIKNTGLIGSILLDLAHWKNLEIENGKLLIKSKDTDLSPTHNMILEQIEKSSRPRKIKTWITKFLRKSSKIQKEISLGLDSKGIIKIHQKSFLGIRYFRTELIDSAIRESIIKEIRDLIFNNKVINSENSLILGLIEACKMHKIIAKDKSEIEICKRKLAELIKSDSIAQGVDKAIKEMQAAIIGAAVASTVVMNAGSN